MKQAILNFRETLILPIGPDKPQRLLLYPAKLLRLEMNKQFCVGAVDLSANLDPIID